MNYTEYQQLKQEMIYFVRNTTIALDYFKIGLVEKARIYLDFVKGFNPDDLE